MYENDQDYIIQGLLLLTKSSMILIDLSRDLGLLDITTS